jgi:hypothetical protein
LWGAPRHAEVVRKLSRDMANGECPLGACRHYRYNGLIEAFARDSCAEPANAALPTLI